MTDQTVQSHQLIVGDTLEPSDVIGKSSIIGR